MWERLWAIFLINDWWKMTWLTMSSAIPAELVLGPMRKLAEQQTHDKQTSKHCSGMASTSVRALTSLSDRVLY